MHVDAARTFSALGNFFPLNPKRTRIVLNRVWDGDTCYIEATNVRKLGFFKRILFYVLLFLHRDDFRLATINALLADAFSQISTLPPLPLGMETNLKNWSTYIKKRVVAKTDKTPCSPHQEDVEKAFYKAFPPMTTFSPRLPSPPHISPRELEEAQQSSPLPSQKPLAMPRGIINQGNWCYFNAFIQATRAASGFRAQLKERVERIPQEIELLQQHLNMLEGQKTAFLEKTHLAETVVVDIGKEYQKLSDSLEKNCDLASKTTIRQRIQELKLPEGLSIEEITSFLLLTQEIQRERQRCICLPAARACASALLSLFSELEITEEKSPLGSSTSSQDALINFIEAMKKFDDRLLQHHEQQDASELALKSLGDLWIDGMFSYTEIHERNKTTPRSPEDTPGQIKANIPDRKDIFISALDMGKNIFASFLPVSLPEPLPSQFSLQHVFDGFLHSYDLEKDKKEIVEQEQNKLLFDGDEGAERKRAFLQATHDPVSIVQKIRLVGVPPLSLPIIIPRYTNLGRQRTCELTIPFILRVSSSDGTTEYILRSAIIHECFGSIGGHYYTYTLDPESLDSASGPRFIRCDDADVYEKGGSVALSEIQTDGYVLFYDRK